MFGNSASGSGGTAGLVAANLAGFGGYWVLRYAGLSMWALAGFMLVALAGCGFGWLIGRILSHKVDGDETFAQVVGWSSLVVWLVPIVGFFVSSMAWELSHAASNRRVRLMCLSMLGCVASLCNGVLWLFLTPQAYG